MSQSQIFSEVVTQGEMLLVYLIDKKHIKEIHCHICRGNEAQKAFCKLPQNFIMRYQYAHKHMLIITS